MKHKRRADCLACGRTEREVGRISRGGLCVECGVARQLANVNGIRNREGPFYTHWLNGIQEAAQRKLAEQKLDSENDPS